MQNTRVAVLAVVMAVAMAAPAAAADPVVETTAETTYYLALGNSLAAGYQPIGRAEDDHRTRMSYPDQLWLMARAAYPNLELVNLGCPGSNTEKIQSADPRCTYVHDSQLAEAIAFIEGHRDQIAFITIDIGFHDFPCDTDISCLFPGIDGIAERLPPILEALKEAAPGVPIVGMNIYDPFLTFWLEGDESLAKQTVVAVQIINETLEKAYADAGIPVADVEAAFAIDDWDTLVPMAGHGMVPRNLALLCERTWQCFPPPLGPDRHPNVLGARAMADAFAAELGLER